MENEKLLKYLKKDTIVKNDGVNNLSNVEETVLINPEKTGLIERVNKKFVTSDGKQLLREQLYEA